ncbi:MAG: hypothetical protein JXB10_08970 [Pirellulales bacterium]|nr:hypothetical protein [Pirellulales bacterium]
MSENTYPREDASPVLRIHEESEKEAPVPEFMELEDQRKHIEDQAQAEKFWAGRNLGDRKSARIAA